MNTSRVLAFHDRCFLFPKLCGGSTILLFTSHPLIFSGKHTSKMVVAQNNSDSCFDKTKDLDDYSSVFV